MLWAGLTPGALKWHVCGAETSTVSGPLRNASEVLMQSSRQVELPSLSVPPAGKELRNDHKLYNDLLSESLSMPQCEVAFYITCTHHFSTCIHVHLKS